MKTYPFELMQLPYEKTSLEPYISQETVDFHYGKHHNGYVVRLNALIAEGVERQIFNDVDFDVFNIELCELIKKSFSLSQSSGGHSDFFRNVFNNAAQIWNHDFFWNGLLPSNIQQNSRSEKLSEMIMHSFESLEKFKAEFKKIATAHFGSGWCWLIAESCCEESNNQAVDRVILKIIATKDAHSPICSETQIPLWVCDLWEHSYYIDYRNDRAKYVDYMLKIINWNTIDQIYKNIY